MSKPRKPEVTSRRVARIAGLILRSARTESVGIWFAEDAADKTIEISWKDIRALAASCLTQTAPKWPALPVKAAPRIKRMMRERIANAEQTMGRPKRGAGAKPLGKYKRRVNLRVRPRPSK